MIVPLNHSSWGQMMAELEEEKDVAAWTFRNAFFLDEIKPLVNSRLYGFHHLLSVIREALLQVHINSSVSTLSLARAP